MEVGGRKAGGRVCRFPLFKVGGHIWQRNVPESSAEIRFGSARTVPAASLYSYSGLACPGGDKDNYEGEGKPLEALAPDSVERFITTALARAGALVEKPGYGLAEVLLPEELEAEFAGDELLLAFDYEVAQETPGSTFVTPGSSLLDSAVRLAQGYGRFTSHFWPGSEVGTPRNLEQKISKTVNYLHCRPPQIAGSWAAENIYYGFYFLSRLFASEKTEEIFSVVINGHSGLFCPTFEKQWTGIVSLDSPEYELGQAQIRPLQELYQAACAAVQPQVEGSARNFQEQQGTLRSRELARTSRYYAETLKELQKKMSSTEDEKKKQRLEKQVEATRTDWKGREEDISARYQVEAEVRLDHIAAYHVPCIFVRVKMQCKKETLQQTLLFNTLDREFETPSCPRCGKPSPQMVPDGRGDLVCPRH